MRRGGEKGGHIWQREQIDAVPEMECVRGGFVGPQVWTLQKRPRARNVCRWCTTGGDGETVDGDPAVGSIEKWEDSSEGEGRTRSEDAGMERPQLVLTRRVTASSLRLGRSASLTTTSLSDPGPSAAGVDGRSTLRKAESDPSFANFLRREEALYAFFVEAGGVGEMSYFNAPRRCADPPQRFLEINFGYVYPGSRQSFNCSDPRVSGTLRQWYEAAHSWGLLRADTRDVLRLDDTRRPVRSDSSVPLQRPPSRPPAPKPAGGRFSQLLSRRVVTRSLDSEPRIIAVGDVHGCIDELQQLMRLVDYRPGDQVVFLGDLVAKGPDSVAVVQLAREINARSVRGNHDHEVVKWREAVNRGERPPLISLEHYRIARSLSAEDQEWLRACPWYISAPDLNVLFVHAGFSPGTRLSQQNPRLMMNMRSVLADGTITAKNVSTKEWARLWTGPETVVFGHDAFRGLQQHPFAYGIDTGCVYGGRLTALILPENRFASVAARRQYVQPPKGRSLT